MTISEDKFKIMIRLKINLFTPPESFRDPWGVN